MKRELKWGRIIAAFTIFVLLPIGLYFAYAMIFKPAAEEDLVEQTSAPGRDCRVTFKMAHDDFSGYYVFRSKEFGQALADEGICIKFKDDKADYVGRHRSLGNGDVDMAVFELSAYLKVAARTGDYPATAVFVIDETKGADGILAFGDVKDVNSLNDPKGRFYATGDSPSEFIARIAYNQFTLGRIPRDKWLVAKKSPEEVLAQMKADVGSGEPRAYALWEPYLSEALKLPGAHVLIDSSELDGLIVDLFMVRREVLAEHGKDIKTLTEVYFRTLFGFQDMAAQTQAIMADKSSLSRGQAETLVRGIAWRNTMDNYHAFGLEGPRAALLESISKIAGILEQTRAIRNGAVSGKERTVFAPSVLQDMKTAGFHPGIRKQLVAGVGGGELKQAAVVHQVSTLDDSGWQALKPVGNLQVEDIGFTRGSARLTQGGRNVLDRLAADLTSWPKYYVRVTGHSLSKGDAAANQQLMLERAKAVVNHMTSLGISDSRFRAEVSDKPRQSSGSSAVSFEVLRPSY